MTARMLWLCTMFLVYGCNNSSNTGNFDKILPDDHMTAEAQAKFKEDVIRYIGKLPGKANHVSKFDTIYNEYYVKLAANHHLKHYYKDTATGYQYFLMTRIAPSLKEKFVAIGGRLKRDNASDKIIFFEEVFRTWKMPDEEINKTGSMLFSEMIRGKNLSRYYTENSGEEFIIEFPDKDVIYDTALRVWKKIKV